MQEENHNTVTGIKRDPEGYREIALAIKGLLEGENNVIANMANVSSVLMDFLNMHWVGFYLVKDDQLVLGPFQGPVACTRISKGRGVCGVSWETGDIEYVPNVHEFPGHIACSPYTRSELVVPIRKQGEIVGVLDIDCTEYDGFTKTDQEGLMDIVKVFEQSL